MLLLQPPGRGAGDARRGVPGDDRRRSAVCGHGSFRQEAGARRLVHAGVAGAGAELFRPGRAASCGDPAAAHLPLYQLVPAAVLPLMVLLATAATIIASQATITGAFSVTRQCIQLDLLPRLRIMQTSAHEHGQIYVPVVNWFVLIAVCMFVLAFRSSDALGAAYGAAVAGTMFITTLLGMQLARVAVALAALAGRGVFGPLMFIDLVYLIGNMTKFARGRLGAADAGDDAVQRVHDLAQRPAAAAQRAARGGGTAVAAAEAAGRRRRACPARRCSWPAIRTTCRPR